MLHFYLRTLKSDKSAFTVSVSKKVAKKAVDRNLIKRRVRAIVKNFKNLPPKLYVIIAKPGSLLVRGTELEGELAELLGKG